MNVDQFRYLYFDLSVGDGNVSSIRQDAASYQRYCGGKASSIRRSFLDFDFDGFVTIGFHIMIDRPKVVRNFKGVINHVSNFLTAVLKTNLTETNLSVPLQIRRSRL